MQPQNAARTEPGIPPCVHGQKVDTTPQMLRELKASIDCTKQEKLQTLLDQLQEQWTDHEAKRAALRQSRDRVANSLYEIRTLLKTDRLFCRVLEAYGIPRQTAYDYFADHERLLKYALPKIVMEVAAEEGIDLTPKRLAPTVEKYKKELSDAKTKEEAREMLRVIKNDSRRKATKKTLTPKEREDALFACAEGLYRDVKPEIREKELQHMLGRLLAFFSVPATAEKAVA